MVELTGYTALDMIGFTDKGQYDPLENYVKNDIVHDADEKMWLCKVDDTRGVTPAEGESWTKYIAPPVANPETIGIGYGTCSTAASTTAKEVTLSGYNLKQNGYVSVLFTYAVPASATLNVNSKGAKPIYYHGSAITADIIGAGDLATFVYDGTNYNLVGVDNVSSQIQALTNKAYQTDDTAETAIADGDYFPYYDSSATGKRKTLWSNIIATLKNTFAKKSDLTSVTNQTGTTATTYIRRGLTFYLNGNLVKALKDISNGATFQNGTNYKVDNTYNNLNKVLLGSTVKFMSFVKDDTTIRINFYLDDSNSTYYSLYWTIFSSDNYMAIDYWDGSQWIGVFRTNSII